MTKTKPAPTPKLTQNLKSPWEKVARQLPPSNLTSSAIVQHCSLTQMIDYNVLEGNLAKKSKCGIDMSRKTFPQLHIPFISNQSQHAFVALETMTIRSILDILPSLNYIKYRKAFGVKASAWLSRAFSTLKIWTTP